jgi:uncharacterized Rossmann fold enzyme
LKQTTEVRESVEWFDVIIGAAKAVPEANATLLPPLIQIQERIREEFGWGLERDQRSIHSLLEKIADTECSVWQQENRQKCLSKISEALCSAKRVVIVGAAVQAEELRASMNYGDAILVADGAIGVFSELENSEQAWKNLVAVVSDADGHPYLDEALIRRAPLILHAHGDNMENWRNLLERCLTSPLPIVLTHQCPEVIEGTINPGGFTDGDRAIALAKHVGVDIENIVLCGFRTDEVGRWSGNTDSLIKSRKLEWMAEVINLTGVKWSDVRDS